MDLVSIINQLPNEKRQLAEQIILQIAQTEGVNVSQTPPPPATNIPLWVAWLRSTGKSKHTIVLYRGDVRRYLANDPTPTPQSIQTYLARRLSEVSPQRVSTERKALRSFFGYLNTMGLWNTNPCATLASIKQPKKEISCPTNEEIMALINWRPLRRKDEPKFRLMLVLLLNTGLRMNEAQSLKKANIDFNNLEIKVMGKGAKERIVPISPFVAGLLKVYIDTYPSPSPYLFSANSNDGYWLHSGFWGMLNLACKQTGIRPLHPHQLRHFFATRTLEHGAKLEVISKILGHASIAITADIYRHIELKELHAEHKAHDPLEQLRVQKLLTGGISDANRSASQRARGQNYT